jgi:hypothetical protein
MFLLPNSECIIEFSKSKDVLQDYTSFHCDMQPRAFFKDFPVGDIFWKGTFLWDNILEGIAMAEGHVCGQYTMLEWRGGLGVYSPRKFLKFDYRKCHFLHAEHPNLLQNLF